jgi:hypothetical protein
MFALDIFLSTVAQPQRKRRNLVDVFVLTTSSLAYQCSGGVIRAFMDRMGEQGGPLRRRHSGEGRAVPELSPFDPDFHLTSRRTI